MEDTEGVGLEKSQEKAWTECITTNHYAFPKGNHSLHYPMSGTVFVTKGEENAMKKDSYRLVLSCQKSYQKSYDANDQENLYRNILDYAYSLYLQYPYNFPLSDEIQDDLCREKEKENPSNIHQELLKVFSENQYAPLKFQDFHCIEPNKYLLVRHLKNLTTSKVVREKGKIVRKYSLKEEFLPNIQKEEGNMKEIKN